MKDVLSTSFPAKITSSHSIAPNQTILTAAKGTGIMFSGTMFEYAGRFALGLVLARFLGAEQYGLYNLADSATFMVIGLSMLGLDTAIVYFVPRAVSEGNDRSLWETLQIGIGLPLLVSAIAGIGLFIFADPLAQGVFHDSRLTLLLRIVAFAIPCGALTNSAVSVTRGFKLMHYKVIAQDIILTLVKLTLVSLLAFTGLTATKAITAYAASMIIACGVMIYFVYRLYPFNRPFSARVSHTKQMLKFSLPLFLAQIVSLLGLNLRILLLGVFNTVTSVGIFSVAARISMIGSAFFNSVAIVSMPIISELYNQKEREQLGHYYKTITKWTFTFDLPIFLFILMFSQPILSIFGPSFVVGYLGLVILACGDLVNAAAGICSTMITMTGKVWVNVMNSIIMLVLTVTLSVVLIPWGGALGAAIATTISVASISLIQVLEVFVLFRLLPYDKSFAKPLIAATLTTLVAYGATHWLFADDPLGTILSVSILFITYAATILGLGLSEEDHMILKRLYDRLSRRTESKNHSR